ncbi:hypothetical protein [Paraburkholderia phenoliruptrix]|uniref:hypothetical protein n=1 Tax=Paraburkholderia phenoliruptrix TaxID=252970 RepID=UPI00285939B5|nr:hypothetical protein [Paraburkholderia phenoliruptrix]MDR6389168.1 chemotaxis protein histidine kinase CheA [Paraburkholderia phenoliruptrix]
MSESKQLTVPERAAIAVGAAEHEKHLMTLAKKYSDITRIANVAGRDQVHAGYMELKNARVAIEKAGKDAREDANAFQKAVIEEVKRLTSITTDEEARLQVLRDEFDAEREREKQAKAAAEKARVDGIRNLIDEIKTCPAECVGRSAAEIQAAIDTMTAHQITLEEFMELAGEAEMAKVAALAKLQDALAAQQAHEAEQARLAAEREALERQRAELAEQERKAAAARAEQEAKDRAERERVEAEQRAAQERAAEAMRQQQAEHEARMAAQQAEIDRQQAEIAAARAEQERIERERQAAIEAEERAKREAAEAESARIAQEEADRIFAEQEAQRIASEAAEAERQRRQRVEFEKNGPDADEMVAVLADHYEVSPDVTRAWLGRHMWAQMEKAA